LSAGEKLQFANAHQGILGKVFFVITNNALLIARSVHDQAGRGNADACRTC
jgi:hypothetical protein